jgi:putative membrane protein
MSPATTSATFLASAASWQDVGMRVVIRVLITAVALFVAAEVVPGIELHGHTTLSKIATLLVVALIFGVANVVIKPIVQTLGCVFYILTLGLFGLVVNGLMLWLTSWVAGKLNEPFHVTGFWPAFWGAIIVGLVSWPLSIVVVGRREDPEPDGQEAS